MLPPVDLDALLNKKLANLTQRGYDVSSGPFYGYSYSLDLKDNCGKI
jgi:hypothetical protein